MFETLTERLQAALRGLGRSGRLSEADVDKALREVRLALLEADVHYQVVKDLVEGVRRRALSEEVSRALNPGQQVVRIVHAELAAALGTPGRLALSGPRPCIVMLVGLQGSGKTTTAAKLAMWLRGRGERVWMAAADPYRPAAADQLRILGEELAVPVYAREGAAAAELCAEAVESARNGGASALLLDTAGRSQLDDAMMDELVAIEELVRPVEILLVADAMTGQQSVNIARGFQARLPLSGLILTKMDGDARGGAAISMRAVTGLAIKFLGTGEGRDALESFEPDRLASRILGMGDVLTLIEKAQAAVDLEEAGRQAERLSQGEFTLEDLAEQLRQVRKLGPVGKILDLLPAGVAGAGPGIDAGQAERSLIRTQAIVQSMTAEERRRPEILNASRKRRVAAGSGTTVQEVNQVLRQHREMRRLFKTVGKRGIGGLPPGLRLA
jgi:signal recognition particle subunit SRP54